MTASPPSTSKCAFVLLAAGWCSATPSPLPADGTAFFGLFSPQDGATLVPGAEVRWTIEVEVVGANFGLALVSCDLRQSPGNPGAVDIPPADFARTPPEMLQFIRPDGISNPGEGGLASGYFGTQRGPPGARNLLQIGGAQNTLGEPGETMGLTVDVSPGIGQGSPQVIAGGTFHLPDAEGIYSFSIENHLANVLAGVGVPPEPSPVEPATAVLWTPAITFTVRRSEPEPAIFHRGDSTADGSINITDGVFIFNFLFLGGPAPTCQESANANDAASINITTGVYLLNFLFLGGPRPPPPGPLPDPCGPDPPESPSNIGCETYVGC